LGISIASAAGIHFRFRQRMLRAGQSITGVLENKHQAVSQGVRHFGKRSMFGHI